MVDIYILISQYIYKVNVDDYHPLIYLFQDVVMVDTLYIHINKSVYKFNVDDYCPLIYVSGCGNGRYLHINKSVYKFNVDDYRPLIYVFQDVVMVDIYILISQYISLMKMIIAL